MIESRQSYSKESRVQFFFGPTCIYGILVWQWQSAWKMWRYDFKPTKEMPV